MPNAECRAGGRGLLSLLPDLGERGPASFLGPLLEEGHESLALAEEGDLSVEGVGWSEEEVVARGGVDEDALVLGQREKFRERPLLAREVNGLHRTTP